ncbi:MAG: alanyl-tRNA editing protein [Deltaproteobacteria bacterium]|nr:alanyl-tRNA editing protein [Deltaproteobacteria bacterium]
MDLPLYLRAPAQLRVSTRVLSVVPVEGRFAVRLADLVLHPGGGGQPPDAGTVDGAPVRGFHEIGGAIHLLLDRPPVADAVLVEVDTGRRLDLAQQHTAQHLLTALALDRLGRATVGFHLPETGYATVDLSGAPAEADLRMLEVLADEAIRADLPVRSRIVAPEELAGLPVRSRGLPEGHVGPVRLVEIEGIDLNTCAGTHVPGLAALQAVRVLSTERIRGGVTRLHYAAGGRLLRHVDAALERERTFNRLLSCGPEDHASALERLLGRDRAAGRERRRLQEELAKHLGAALPTEDGVAVFHRQEADLAFLGAVATAALEADPDRLVLCTCDDPAGEGCFVLGGPSAPVAAEGPVVAALLKGRGGGPPGRFQGRASRIDRRDEAVAHLRGRPR